MSRVVNHEEPFYLVWRLMNSSHLLNKWGKMGVLGGGGGAPPHTPPPPQSIINTPASRLIEMIQ
jgi:hypothetical protein